MFYKDWTLIKIIKTSVYYVHFLIKGKGCSYKLRYEGYLKLICRCLSNNMYTELTRNRIIYGAITYIYEKTHMIVM